MLTLLFVIFVCVMLVRIFARTNGGYKPPRGLGVQPCPYCYEPMHRKATICRHCMHKSSVTPICAIRRWRHCLPRAHERRIGP